MVIKVQLWINNEEAIIFEIVCNDIPDSMKEGDQFCCLLVKIVS